MSIIDLPQGIRLDIKFYIIGTIDDEPLPMMITVGNMRKFSSDVKPELDVPGIVKAYNLDELASNWRAMTDEEIADYLKQQEEEDDNTFTIPL